MPATSTFNFGMVPALGASADLPDVLGGKMWQSKTWLGMSCCKYPLVLFFNTSRISSTGICGNSTCRTTVSSKPMASVTGLVWDPSAWVTARKCSVSSSVEIFFS